jgi:hypothetical protein
MALFIICDCKESRIYIRARLIQPLIRHLGRAPLGGPPMYSVELFNVCWWVGEEIILH